MARVPAQYRYTLVFTLTAICLLLSSTNIIRSFGEFDGGFVGEFAARSVIVLCVFLFDNFIQVIDYLHDQYTLTFFTPVEHRIVNALAGS